MSKKDEHNPDEIDRPVCDSQSNFNDAFRIASKFVIQERVKRNWTWILIYSFLWLIFLIWAMVLALKVPENRIEHLIFAMIFSPLYVLAYYTSQMIGKKE